MYVLRPGEHPSHPVNRLLEDLLEARGRGAAVTAGSAGAPGPWPQSRIPRKITPQKSEYDRDK